MDDLTREKTEGFDFDYLADVLTRKEEIGDRYQTPGFGLAAQLFASMAKQVIEKLGPAEGEALLKEAVESFGRERGQRIARRVREQGLSLTFKNWLIYGDIDSNRNFQPVPAIEDGDLVARVYDCTFHRAAEAWGLGDPAQIYCRYVDYAILEGYNPDIKLVLEERQSTGRDHCVFRYIMKEGNKYPGSS